MCVAYVIADEATAALQDCFECTDWQMFRNAASQDNINLEEYTISHKSEYTLHIILSYLFMGQH